ncbi:sensor histidine kinase [Deinococcus misasensis]|uniref:sensor histidine kinase n=1 Tax=Deinococcus misasensis TaxID=392413 RepID=UPI0005599915|nr:HAMP domain-containing sensor histidine kinase [Deinococcus misasensis]
MTLRWRLTLLYTTAMGLILSFIMVMVFTVMTRIIETNIQNDLKRGVNQLVSIQRNTETYAIGNRIPWELFPDLYGQLDSYLLYPDTNLLTLQGKDLIPQHIEHSTSLVTLLGDGLNSLEFQPPDYSRMVRAGQNNEVVFTSLEIKNVNKENRHLEVISVMVQISNPNFPIYQGILHLARDTTEIQDVFRALKTVLFFVTLLAIVGMGFTIYGVSARALKPLRYVQAAAETITEKNLSSRVPVPNTHDEVESLASTINEALARLEKSFEMQRRFTSDASHELRTPVTAIGGHAGYLLRRTNPSPQQTESLTIIKNESERLSHLIQSLLELARADAGSVNMNLQPMLALPFMEDLQREMKPILGQAELLVEGQEFAFMADPSRMKQVMINLISNALKAGSTRIILQGKLENKEVHFMVQDNGPGIAEEHLTKLFDRFYRVQESRNRDEGGSGLGLSIVKTIIDAHQGRVWFASRVGEGTTVHVVLPYREVVTEE